MARQTVDILRDLPEDEVFFEQSPIAVDELSDYKILVQRLNQLKLHQLSGADQKSLLSLALRFRPGRHKMVGLENSLMTLLLESRALFKDKIRQDHPQAITFYQLSEYIHSQTILNNIFFGRMKTDSTKIQDKINQSIIQLLIEEDLLETIIETGMQYEVGRMGEKLSGGQRQKLAIARVFLKKPKLLIMDEATSALDNKSQSRIQNLLETRWKGKATLIAIVHRLDTIKSFDRIAVMKAGKIIEMGPYQELIEKKGALHELVYGRR
jgi:ABC-type transport system involved in Fe-S cluster assembly fused permease/ATPase subunit